MIARKIVCIAGSPRKGGNSERLLDRLIDSARKAGAEVDKIHMADLDIEGCIECGGCEETGICVIGDDMQQVYPRVIEADVIVIATPLFFMNVPSQLKAFIDRFQCVWSKKFLLKAPLRDNDRIPAGIVLAVGGTKGKKLFDGLDQLLNVFFISIGVKFDPETSLYYRSVDRVGDIDSHETAMADAAKLGRRLAKG